MDVEFCIAAVEEALARFGAPGIFNTDQGSQFSHPDSVRRADSNAPK
jgi:putative transposase